MNRSVVYITNQHPLYLKMVLASVGMLRQHNTRIPVRVFLINDHSAQTIQRENVSLHVDVNEDNSAFIAACESLNVEVLPRIPLVYPGEEKFFHINRKYFAELPEANILYIDADTFIFGDVETIFDNHQYVDFAACKAEWAIGRGWSSSFLAKPVGPFSSGIMLWDNHSIRDWCDRLPAYMASFRENDTTLANWLHSLHEDCLLREEFSVTKHISETNLVHSFISQEECHLIRTEQCIEQVGNSTIFHSYTPNWKKVYHKLYGKKPKKVALGTIKKKFIPRSVMPVQTSDARD
jgi:hypothetical protein